LQKLKERKAMLLKGHFQDGNHSIEQWKSVMSLGIMSSDESEIEDGEEVLLVHPLPFLSSAVEDLKRNLDEQIKAGRTPQARRQLKKRLVGCPSMRGAGSSLPPWCIKD
jgi:hypothetical protein